MSTAGPPVVIADDVKLVQLAAPRAEPLFPILNRANALTPLLALFAVLPGLVALSAWHLDEQDASWGLKSLRLLSADLGGAIDPATLDPPTPLRFYPPLTSWLTAAIAGVLDPSWLPSIVAVSYVSTCLLVGAVYLLFRSMAGPRVALWAAAILACHGALLVQVQDPSPQSLSAFLSVATFYAFIMHLRRATVITSLWLLAGGVALGLNVLAGGALALLTILVLLVYVLGLRGEHARRGRPGELERGWVGWSAMQSLFVLICTGAAVGGWWVLLMLARHGEAFRAAWLAGIDVTALPTEFELYDVGDSYWRHLGERFLLLTGGLAGLCILGLALAVRDRFSKKTDEHRRRFVQFLIIWSIGSLLVWGVTMHGDAAAAIVELWRSTAVVPLVGLAAFAIEAISARRVPLTLALATGVATLAGVGWVIAAQRRLEQNDYARGAAWLLLFGACAGLLLAILRRYAHNRDRYRRVILAGIVLGLIAFNATLGFWQILRDRSTDASLLSLSSVLSGEADAGILVSRQTPPLRLRYAMRAAAPRVPIVLSESWEAGLAGLDDAPRIIAVEWSNQDTRPTNLAARQITAEQLGQPEFFAGRQLRAFLLTRGPVAAPTP